MKSLFLKQQFYFPLISILFLLIFFTYSIIATEKLSIHENNSNIVLHNAKTITLDPSFQGLYPELPHGAGIGHGGESGFPFVIPQSKAIQVHIPDNVTFSCLTVMVVDVGSAGARLDAFDEYHRLVGYDEAFGHDIGISRTVKLSVSSKKENRILRAEIYQPRSNEVDGMVIGSVDTSCSDSVPPCEGMILSPSFNSSIDRKYCVTKMKSDENSIRSRCQEMKGVLLDMRGEKEFGYLSSKIGEPVFINSWQGNNYGSTCMVFNPEGSVTVPEGGCNGPFAGICELPL